MRRNAVLTSISLLLLLATQSCAAAAFVDSMMTDFKLEQLQRQLAVNAWTDAGVVESKSHVLYDSQEEIEGVVAPAWSYNCLALRVAALVEGLRLQAPEIQISVLSDSGLRPQVEVGGEVLAPCGEFHGGWLRFRLGGSALAQARSEGLRVIVTATVGRWEFPLVPTYFEGFDRRLRGVPGVQVGSTSPETDH